MRHVMTGHWRSGLLIGVMVGVAILVVACGEDEQAQPTEQQTVVQQTLEAEQQTTESQAATQQQQEEASSESTRQAAEEERAQAEPQQQDEQATVDVAEQQDQSQPDASDSTDDGAGEQQQSDSSQQQATTQSATPEQQGQQSQQGQQQMVPEESVPGGTRLITLFGDITEIVYALGAQEYLVARDTSSIYPREAEELPNLGFAGALNAEAILDFEPTLIIGTPMAGPPEVLEQLRQAGVDVLIIEGLNDLDAPQIKIRFVGQALGIPGRAEALAVDVEKRMETVMAAAENDKPLRVMHIYIRRGGLQLVSGEGNKAQAIIEAAGGVDAAAEAGIVGWLPLTPEALVAADPDVYLVMDRGLAVVGGIEGLLEIPGMAETNAGRGQHVISMADLYLLGFGPRLPEAIADLAQFLRDIQEQVLESE